MSVTTAGIVSKLEAMVGCYCEHCLKKHSRDDLDGGRCYGCGSSICSMRIEDQPTFTVQTKIGNFSFRCTNLRVARKVVKVAFFPQNVIEPK